MNARATAAVEKGATLLTEHFGNTDWVNRIDPDKLYAGSCEDCPLGQLFGEFLEGRDELGLTPDEATSHGFECGVEYSYGELDRAWSKYLTRV